MKVIIFDNGNGVSVITPAPNSDLTAEQVAAKDVPNGAAFEIVDDSILPWDKPRETWEWV